MAEPPKGAKDPVAPAANGNTATTEHTITLGQIQIFIMVCVAGAIGTFVSKILALDTAVANYSALQTIAAGACAAAIMVFYLARTDTRNVIYACVFALLCGMVGPTVLQKAVKDFKEGIEAGNQVKEDAEAAKKTVNAPPTTPDAVKNAENQANKVIASTQTAVEKDAPKADVQSGKDAVDNIVDKLQQTVAAPNTPDATKEKATEALERIGQSAQQANLPKVARKAEDVRRSEPIVATFVSRLTNADDQTLRAIQAQVADIGQPAVRPLVAELIQRSGKNSPADDNVRLAAAGALAKMKQPIVLTTDEAKAVVTLIQVSDAQTRLAAAEFLMNLEDQQTIHYAFRELQQIARNPGNPDDKIQGAAVYNTAVVLGTWARNLKEGIKAPADAGGPNTTMARAALQEAKQLDELLKKRGAAKWKHTISDLEDLIKKAEAKP